MTRGIVGGGAEEEEEDPLAHLYPEYLRRLPEVPKGQHPPHLNLQKTRVVHVKCFPRGCVSFQLKPIQDSLNIFLVRCTKEDSRRTVCSSELNWLPNGSEFLKESKKPDSKPSTYTKFNCSQDSVTEFSSNSICPTDDKIILAKLGAGQEIELEAHAVKGIGKTHAKCSPVATAWYRMHPEVILLEDGLAEELVKKCPVNVFDIEDIGNGRKKATVARRRSWTLCRECIRGESWDKRVALRRIKDHFIFTIESTGALPPEDLFTEAVKILKDKCERVITELS